MECSKIAINTLTLSSATTVRAPPTKPPITNPLPVAITNFPTVATPPLVTCSRKLVPG